MENTFEEVTEVYEGAKLTDDFEDTGNRILEKYWEEILNFLGI